MNAYDIKERMERAIDNRDLAEIVALFAIMRAYNIGEAWIPGLKNTCQLARELYARLNAPEP